MVGRFRPYRSFETHRESTILGHVKRITLKLFGFLFALFAIPFMVFIVFSRYSRGPTIIPSKPSASEFTILEYVFGLNPPKIHIQWSISITDVPSAILFVFAAT